MGRAQVQLVKKKRCELVAGASFLARMVVQRMLARLQVAFSSTPVHTTHTHTQNEGVEVLPGGGGANF